MRRAPDIALSEMHWSTRCYLHRVAGNLGHGDSRWRNLGQRGGGAYSRWCRRAQGVGTYRSCCCLAQGVGTCRSCCCLAQAVGTYRSCCCLAQAVGIYRSRFYIGQASSVLRNGCCRGSNGAHTCRPRKYRGRCVIYGAMFDCGMYSGLKFASIFTVAHRAEGDFLHGCQCSTVYIVRQLADNRHTTVEAGVRVNPADRVVCAAHICAPAAR